MVSPRATKRAILVGFCWCVGLTQAANAQETRVLRLELTSGCPSRGLLVSELAPLLRGYELGDDSTALVARIEDQGESYRVSVAGASREVRDPNRQCLERARVAAVFLALNLPAPAPAAPTPTPTGAPSSEDQAAPRLDEASRYRTLAFDLRPFAQAESAWGAGVASTGLGLGASLRLRSLALTLQGAATTSTTPYQPAGEPPRFELQRIPFALLLGWQAGLGLLDFGAEAGGALDVLRFSGQSVPNPDAALRVSPGVRLNALIRVRASRRLAAELMPALSWFPRTYIVRVEPGRILAETPRWWLGVNLGLSYEVWGR